MKIAQPASTVPRTPDEVRAAAPKGGLEGWSKRVGQRARQWAPGSLRSSLLGRSPSSLTAHPPFPRGEAKVAFDEESRAISKPTLPSEMLTQIAQDIEDLRDLRNFAYAVAPVTSEVYLTLDSGRLLNVLSPLFPAVRPPPAPKFRRHRYAFVADTPDWKLRLLLHRGISRTAMHSHNLLEIERLRLQLVDVPIAANSAILRQMTEHTDFGFYEKMRSAYYQVEDVANLCAARTQVSVSKFDDLETLIGSIAPHYEHAVTTHFSAVRQFREDLVDQQRIVTLTSSEHDALMQALSRCMAALFRKGKELEARLSSSLGAEPS